MKIEQIWNQILAVRKKSPLVHSISNYVAMDITANTLLAAGASPIMAHAHPEMAAMVAIADAVVINIGTLDEYWVESMHLAARQANASGKPWVLDPVGAGATAYRDEVVKQLLHYMPAIIRGNASEILALASKNATATKGVDSTHDSSDALAAARLLNQRFGSVVSVSGATDIIVHGGKTARLSNGHALMTRITGMGCAATALTAAFAAISSVDYYLAAVSAMALLGVAGQLAAERADGPGSLQLHILDMLYSLSAADFFSILNMEEDV